MNIPRINILTGYFTMLHHPRYKAAKAGDLNAALALVDTLIPDYRIFRHYTGYVCPVLKKSGNMIPLALATRISQYSSMHLVDTVHLLNSKQGSAMIYRMFYNPEYNGAAPAGNYVIVDDVFTTGITLKGLKKFLESSGSNVITSFTLSCSKHGNFFEPSALKLQILKARFPQIENYFKLSDLTIAQVDYLLKFNTLYNLYDLHYNNIAMNIYGYT